MESPVRAVMTPCIGVCTLDPAGNCLGCLRTRGEIGAWLSMTDAERAWVMEVLLPAREAARR